MPECSILTGSRILQASKVPEHAVMANRTMIRQGIVEPIQVQRALNHRVSPNLLPLIRAQADGAGNH